MSTKRKNSLSTDPKTKKVKIETESESESDETSESESDDDITIAKDIDVDTFELDSSDDDSVVIKKKQTPPKKPSPAKKTIAKKSSPKKPSPKKETKKEPPTATKKPASPVKKAAPPAPPKTPVLDLPKYVVLLRNLQDSFQLAWVPQALACREKEKDSIYKLWTQAIVAHEPCAMYISGSPGTGKSASIREIWNKIVDFENDNEYGTSKIIYLNCMELSNPNKIFTELCSKLSIKDVDNAKEAESALRKHICTKKKGMITLILDEIDGLITGNKEVLYKLFENTTIPKSRLILIGIANAMDLTQRVLPDLKLRNCDPLLVNFVRYEKPEILKIIQQRIDAANPPVQIFDNAAIQLIATKVGAHSGDVRKALEICRVGLEDLEIRVRKEPSLVSTAKISIKDISQVIERLLGSHEISVLKGLTTQAKLLVCALVFALDKPAKSLKGKNYIPSISYDQLHETYISTCKTAKIPSVESSSFKDLVDVLISNGMIGLEKSKGKKDIAQSLVSLSVNSNDVRFAFQDLRPFNSIVGEPQ